MNTKRAVGLSLMLTVVLACQSAQAFYNPRTGRWLSRDPIGEDGGVNLYGIVGNNPISFTDVNGLIAKKCGVASFSVTWKAGVPDKSGQLLGLFRIDVKIVFKKGGEYDPRCCEYKQNAKTKFKIISPNSAPNPWIFENTMHDDGYSRGSDLDGNKDVTDPHFETNDNPGPSALLATDEIEYYEFTSEQIVYSPGKVFKGDANTPSCECEENDEVAKKGPHTGKVSGKLGKLKYEGVPKNL